MVEFFAGVGRISRLSAACGYRVGALDVVYDTREYLDALPKSESSKARVVRVPTNGKSSMDLTTDAGFL